MFSSASFHEVLKSLNVANRRLNETAEAVGTLNRRHGNKSEAAVVTLIHVTVEEPVYRLTLAFHIWRFALGFKHPQSVGVINVREPHG